LFSLLLLLLLFLFLSMPFRKLVLVQQASPRPATEKDQSIITYNKSRIETRAGGNKKASDHAGRPAGGCTKKERIQKRSRNIVVIVGYVAVR
jgi:hypothetical protein